VASLVIVFQPFWFYRTDKQTHTQTDADGRYTPATLVGVSNKSNTNWRYCTQEMKSSMETETAYFTKLSLPSSRGRLMSSKLHQLVLQLFIQSWHPLANYVEKAGAVCLQVKLCDPHLSALDVRFSRRGAIQIYVYPLHLR